MVSIPDCDVTEFQATEEALMLLTQHQVSLLLEDLDYILPRTRCDALPLTKNIVMREAGRDGDVLLDLIEGMTDSDARFLSVPLETVRGLISRRRRGAGGQSQDQEDASLPSLF